MSSGKEAAAEPIHFSVDITGVTVMKVVCQGKSDKERQYHNVPSYYTALGNAGLYE